MITRVSEEPAASIFRSQVGKSEMSLINEQTTLCHTAEDHSIELNYLLMNVIQIVLFLYHYKSFWVILRLLNV
jgi:hypothetical protein